MLLIVGWINNSMPSVRQENNLKICKLEGEGFQEMGHGLERGRVKIGVKG